MPRLTLVETGSARSHRIDGVDVLAGRDPSCGIFLEGDEARTVSGRHARFFFDNDKWYVEDAGSRNGTYIGTHKLEPGARHALTVGEVIGLGLTGTQLTVRELAGRSLAATMLEAAPAPVPPPAQANAVRVVLRGQAGTFAGQGERITIGRAMECDIRVEGELATSVSRVHAEIGLAKGQPTLRDGGSRHGTFLNGQKLEAPAALHIGDVLMLGPGGPTFTVEEAGAVAGGAGAPSVAAAAAPSDPAVGPTAVRAATKKRASPPNAGRESDNEAATRPTPPTDGSTIQKPGVRRRSPSAATARSQRPVAAMVGGAVLLVAVIAAGVFIARGRASGPNAVDLAREAEDLEVSRTEAIANAARIQATLDSATNAAAPQPLLDSLRQASTAANGRVTQLGDSLERTRARLGRGR